MHEYKKYKTVRKLQNIQVDSKVKFRALLVWLIDFTNVEEKDGFLNPLTDINYNEIKRIGSTNAK